MPLRAGVVEGDVLKLDQSAGVPQRAGVGPVEHRGLLVLKLGDPLSRRRGRIHRGAEPSQTANGTVEAPEVGEKDEQLTQGEPRLGEHPDAHADHRERARHPNEGDQRRHQRLGTSRHHIRLKKPEILALKTSDFCFLTVVGLHELGV